MNARTAGGSPRPVVKIGAFPPTPTPLSVLYPHSRQLSPRVRVFVDWVAQIFASR